MLEANFWQDKIKSKKIIKEKKLFEDLIGSYEDSVKKLKDFDELNELASEENNIDITNEIFHLRSGLMAVKKNRYESSVRFRAPPTPSRC